MLIFNMVILVAGRKWDTLYSKFVVLLQAIAVMVGLCFVDSLHLTQAGVQATQGALFMLVTENTFGPMYAMLSLFPTELPLFLRHHRAGLYGPLAYYMAKIIAIVSITDECRRSSGESCLPVRSCTDSSGLLGFTRAMSFLSSQGGRNRTPPLVQCTSLGLPSRGDQTRFLRIGSHRRIGLSTYL